MLKASLARRFIVFSSLLTLVTSLSLSFFMLTRQRGEWDEHIRQRGVSLARNLAHNAELAVLTRNRDLLLDLSEGLLQLIWLKVSCGWRQSVMCAGLTRQSSVSEKISLNRQKCCSSPWLMMSESL